MISISGRAEDFGNRAKCDRAINIYFLRGGTTSCMSRISANCKMLTVLSCTSPGFLFNILCLISTFKVIIAITEVGSLDHLTFCFSSVFFKTTVCIAPPPPLTHNSIFIKMFNYKDGCILNFYVPLAFLLFVTVCIVSEMEH